ncbi:hypothetical protein [Peribacillus sp. Hz7]|uniref:hypothetical protein n=1 Tax=Peribacillus sp. Hz7 TaxID=3344873 RepID=UPI0035CA234C
MNLLIQSVQTKKLIFSIVMVFIFAILPSKTYSENVFEKLPPCSTVLEPTKGISDNAKGVALIYNIERAFNDKRTSLSVHALHLPKPSSVFVNIDLSQSDHFKSEPLHSELFPYLGED